MENSVDPILTRLIHHAEVAAEATNDARQLAERDRDYYDGKQLTAEEEGALKARNQPVVILNRIKPKIDFLLGSEIMGRTQVKAFPRTPIHEEDADSITDAIRYVSDDAKFDAKRSAFAKNLLIEGIGACTVTVNPTASPPKVMINNIPWDRFYYDPHSRSPDFSDAKYLGIVQWMDEDDVIAMNPQDAPAIVDGAYSDYNTGTTGTYEDKPHFWTDPKRKRIKVCQEYWLSQGVWHHAIFTKTGFIVAPEKSPYVNDEGQSISCIVPRSVFVDRNGNRYGVVRQLISPQDEINKRRSKALHLMTTRTIVTERGAVDDIEQVRKEVHKPDGVIEVNGGMRFEIETNADMAQSHLGFMAEAKAEIDAIGANAALTGATDRSLSGRAVQALQQGGTIELAPVMDAIKAWQQDVYSHIWYAIRQFWTAETWVRVTDDEKNLKWVGLNQPLTMADQLIQEQQANGVKIPPHIEQQLRQNPAASMVVGKKNDLSAMTVDIVLDDVPDTVVMQQEQFEQLVQLAPQAASMPPQLFEALIEASSLRNKHKIIDKLKGKGQEEQQIPPEIQMQMQQMGEALQAMQAEYQKLQQEHQAMLADQQLKAAEMALKNKEIQVKSYDAETKRMEVESKNEVAMVDAQASMIEADAKQKEAAASIMEAQASMATVISPIITSITSLSDGMRAIENRLSQPKRARAVLSDGSIVQLEQQ